MRQEERIADRVHRPAAGGAVAIWSPTRSSTPCRETGAEAVHPGLRLPVGERRLRASAAPTEGIVFIGPNPHAIEAMGDKIESQEVRRQGRRLGGAGPHGRDRRRRPRHQDLRGDRLSGDDQGLGRRRRQGHPRRLEPQGRRGGLPGGAGRGQGQLRRRPHLHREVHREPAPHRDPGAGRQARQRRPPVRARVLDPAPQPEGHRGGAEPAARRRRPARPWAPRPSPWPRPSTTTAPARSSSSPARTRASSSWR